MPVGVRCIALTPASTPVAKAVQSYHLSLFVVIELGIGLTAAPTDAVHNGIDERLTTTDNQGGVHDG